MIKQNSQEKLVNAIIYFSTNTKYCFKTKLYKLLYHFDFEHFRECGRNVTNLQYYAWPKGPVPLELHNRIDISLESRAKCLYPGIKVRTHSNSLRVEFAPEKEFDPRVFSKRELRLLKRIATENKILNAGKMIEGTHLENLPWHQVYEVEGRKQEHIPYSYAAKKAEVEDIEHIAKERKEFLENYCDTGDSSI